MSRRLRLWWRQRYGNKGWRFRIGRCSVLAPTVQQTLRNAVIASNGTYVDARNRGFVNDPLLLGRAPNPPCCHDRKIPRRHISRRRHVPISNNEQRSHHQTSSSLRRKAVLAGGVRFTGNVFSAPLGVDRQPDNATATPMLSRVEEGCCPVQNDSGAEPQWLAREPLSNAIF